MASRVLRFTLSAAVVFAALAARAAEPGAKAQQQSDAQLYRAQWTVPSVSANQGPSP